MKFRYLPSLFVLATVGAQLSCSRDATTGPSGLIGSQLVANANEPLQLTLNVRTPIPRERLPRVRVTAMTGSVRVQVDREDFACTLANGFVGRGPGVLTFVARVGGDPRANCSGGWVVEYAGVMKDVAPGRYTVHVYEGGFEGVPRWLTTATVTVQ